MTENIQTRVETINIMILNNDVVRQNLASPSFEITEWSVKRLSDQGIMNPDGLWLFHGEGRDDHGSRPWRVVLKVLSQQDEEPALNNMWHWKRE